MTNTKNMFIYDMSKTKNRPVNAMVVQIIYFSKLMLWNGEKIMSKACKRPDHESSLNLGAPYEADTKIE
jgi:hypothetical protein